MWAKVNGPLKRRTGIALVLFNLLMLCVSLVGIVGSLFYLLDELQVVDLM